MHNGNMVIGDSNGNLTWHGQCGELIKTVPGSSGIVLMTSDSSKSILMVGREKEHTFEMFTYKEGLTID